MRTCFNKCISNYIFIILKIYIMKAIIYFLLTFLFLSSTNAQQSRGIFGTENWTENWTNYKPKTADYREAEFILNGEIKTNTTLSRKNTYLLVGSVIVKANTTLTIEAGTVIRGDFSTAGTLIVEAGAKIIANGTATDPIVFTSNKGASDRNAGDWGGVFILGNASTNKLGGNNSLGFENNARYGGNNMIDNSGIFRYVRIEFAGKKINNILQNGLVLAGVGSATNVEFVQISFSKGNGFAFKGGNITTKNLITFKNSQHDFDFNEGTQVNISNSLAFKFPYFADASASNCMDIKSYSDKNETDFSKKFTTVTASNMTMINFDEKLEGIVNQAILVAENVNFSLNNSVVNGFFPAVVLSNEISDDKLKNISLQNNLLNFCKDPIVYSKKGITTDLNAHYSNESFKNKFDYLDIVEVFEVPDFKSNSNFMLKANNEKNVVTFR